MSAQQSAGVKWFGYNYQVNSAATKSNFDVPQKTYPLDIAMADGTWVWPISDVTLINTLAYDSAIPTSLP